MTQGLPVPSTHTRSDSVVAALAARTVTVIVLQLIRENAIARAIRVTKLAVQRHSG